MDTPTNITKHIIEPSSKMLTIMGTVATAFLLFAISFFLYQSNLSPANAPKEINVTGEGKAYIKPDIAMVSFGVTSQAPKSQDAVSQSNEKMNAVIAAIKALGVEDKDIQTTSYNLSPVYDYKTVGVSPMMYPVPVQGGRSIVGYTLDQEISVKIRNFDNINTIMDKASVSGANTVGQLQFTVDNPEAARSEARQKAIDAAKEKMQNIAKESGLNVGKLINVSEGYSSYPQPMYANSTMAKDSGAPSVAPDIQAGQMEADSNITLTYQVR